MAHPEPVILSREPTVAAFEAERLRLREQSTRSMGRVATLSREQVTLGEQLQADLRGLSTHSDQLALLQRDAQPSGLLASLLRTFTARNEALQRRSATHALTQRYESVQTALRRATALADDLRLCAVELQASVDDLHESRASSRADSGRVAQRVLAVERALDGVDTERERDALQFELAQESTRLSLLTGMAELCEAQLGPARTLRDTVQSLHQQTAQYVLNAAGTVNEAGRSVQALGVAADAPLVVHELQQALLHLETAMSGTSDAIELAQHLVVHVLPDLDAQLSASDETRRLVSETRGGPVDVRMAHAHAERALRLAAQAEVEALGP